MVPVLISRYDISSISLFQLGISWFTNLQEVLSSSSSPPQQHQGGYRLQGTCSESSLLHWTPLVTAASASSLLLGLLSQPLTLIKFSSHAPGSVLISARRFNTTARPQDMTLPAPGKPASSLLVVPSVIGRPLQRGGEARIFLGQPDGGLFERTLSVAELCRGLMGERTDEVNICLLKPTYCSTPSLMFC